MFSGSSVGFGDFTPETDEGKILSIIYLPILVILTVMIFSNIYVQAISPFVDDEFIEMETLSKTLDNFLNFENFEERFNKVIIIFYFEKMIF